ncbi:hypothetical protein [Fusobacterium phage Fnu1]|uniref:Uncharacterized protein n=1 Tax=Fusobacterium phage Fnu1 TaxID=2530024 RepID=A0A481W668_9CAUD|nr:hypothetical protein KMD24_gp171 [Fusobacterium phage Fnu1]QBJ04216.1 hypothetical protein [Fusobacterium phage Fnu1]WGH50309.1 hypothetical protein FNU2_94 [Fusobacterium phage vB_FnuS_FNU2]
MGSSVGRTLVLGTRSREFKSLPTDHNMPYYLKGRGSISRNKRCGFESYFKLEGLNSLIGKSLVNYRKVSVQV